ncbi:MAG TPA: S-methyl-5-thioribose-1-phosphate isomerase [Burkholderiaceae bacterium]|nr:S-methyl-5-thioribose-1-phosphate isomerase [Burkholderiaceae bacterium]
MNPDTQPVQAKLRVQTLRWHDDRLELLDQRLLPALLEYCKATTAQDVAQAIRAMVVRGAPAIGCAAAYGVALAARELRFGSRADFAAGMEKAFALLAASRPTAVNLFWALQRMRGVLQQMQGQDMSTIAEVLLDEAHAVLAEDIEINRALGTHGAQLLSHGARVLTHCNAGALATAGYGTALGVVRSAIESGKQISVIANETRPFLQGARLTAWELVQEGIAVTLITDGMSGHLMSRGEIDAVVVGADRVAANGDVANKIGSYMLAVLARRHGIPFYVACPLSSIDQQISDGSRIPIEERPSEEVLGFGETRWAPSGVAVRNPAFDVTPADLVSALITERGVVLKPDAQKIAALLSR